MLKTEVYNYYKRKKPSKKLQFRKHLLKKRRHFNLNFEKIINKRFENNNTVICMNKTD